MEIEHVERILAVVTRRRDAVGGGAPVFYAQSAEELAHKALLLSKTVRGMIHEVDPDTLVIVKH